ncbi:anaphase-promoting complex subunit 11 RING-H2 finger-domain-containing protein [Dissophora ornata]|nr:anaphase-promoting complex subunit 11 RING-H2 finger-domain-containing protein [Dissophora ornata]
MEDSTDVCGICHSPFDACCSYCKMPGDSCPLLWGKCTHCFHLHCISKWLETKDSEGRCPMDRQLFGKGASTSALIFFPTNCPVRYHAISSKLC